MTLGERHPFETVSINELLLIILRRFKLLLSQHGFDLDDDALKTLADCIAEGDSSADVERLNPILVTLIEASETVLAQWNLTLVESLKTGVDQITGWESTAEFLEIANHKHDAEQRIVNFSALLVVIGESQFFDNLTVVIQHDPDDVDAIIARRVIALTEHR